METIKSIFPHTTSRRLVLHPATAADRANFFQTVVRTGHGSSRQEARPSSANSNPYAAFVVAHRTSNEVLGFSALHGLDPAGHIRSVYIWTPIGPDSASAPKQSHCRSTMHLPR